MHTLAITVRDMNTDLAKVRKEGFIPAVLYGPKEESAPISVSTDTFSKLWKVAGESSIISLTGVGEDKEALIQEVSVDPVTSMPLHVDFYVIERGKKLKVSVPIEFVGEAPAEKLGHMVVKVMHEVEMEVRPSELPQHLEINLENLTDVGDTISTANLTLPPSAELTAEEDEIIASVTGAREEEPEEVIEPEAVEGAEGAESTEGAEEKTSTEEGSPKAE